MNCSKVCFYNEVKKQLDGIKDVEILNDWYLGKLYFLAKDVNNIPLSAIEKGIYKSMQEQNDKLRIIRFELMCEINDLFKENNIEVIFFKGECLSRILYSKPIRPVGDLDIFVNKDNLNLAQSLLIDNGFILLNEDDPHHVILEKKDFKVELHKEIFNPQTNIDNDFFIKNTREIEIDNNVFLTLNQNATILHLIFHLYNDALWAFKKYKVLTNPDKLETKRFLYRAFEIVYFLEKYHDEINNEIVIKEICSRKYKPCFLEELKRIINIFSNVKGIDLLNQIIDAIDISYFDDDLEYYVYKMNGNYKQGTSQYIKEKWFGTEVIISDDKYELEMSGIDKNVKNKTGTYVIGEYPEDKKDLSCNIQLVNKNDVLAIEISVCDNVLIFKENRDLDTICCDCVGVFLVNISPYKYLQLFFVPRIEKDKLSVDVLDVSLEKFIELDKCSIIKTKQGYKILAEIPYFIFDNESSDEFLFEIHIADSDSKNECKKTTLALAGNNLEWYNPCCFTKIIKKRDEQ